MQNALLVGSVVVSIAILALLVGVGWGVWQFNRIDRVGVDLAAAAADAPQNFLLVGSDTRSEIDDSGVDSGAIFGGSEVPSGQRADTLVVARLQPRTGGIEILSIPRDLWVRDGGKGRYEKINAAYNHGAQHLVDTVTGNLGIPIHHYVEVNFASFKGLVDAVGGVQLYFDRPVRDSNTGLNIRRKGCYNLDGVTALAFARSRHLVYSNGKRWVSDPTADLGRITRQQVFLRHALAKVATLGLGDLATVRRLVGVAVDNVKIDDSLSTDEMIRLGRKYSKVDAAELVTHRLPTTSDRTSGGDVLRVDDTAAGDVLDIFTGRAKSRRAATSTTRPSISAAAVTVDVLNATGVAGAARQASAALGEAGFIAGTVGNTTSVTTTTVRYSKGSRAAAELIAASMSGHTEFDVDPTLDDNHVVLVLAAGHGEVTAPTAGTSTVADPSATTTAPEASTTAVGVEIGDPPPGINCG